MAIDWISKIDFVLPVNYRSNVNNPTVIQYGTIPGNLVLECPLPSQSIKSEDDFFANDSQQIEIKIHYDATQINDALFYQLTEANFTIGLNGVARYTDELDGCIVKIYNRSNVCVFDGILCVDGKGFNTEDFTITFKVFDLMRAFKERAELQAYDADGTIGKLISFLYMTNAEFAFYIGQAFKEYRAATGYTNINNWTSSPMAVINNAPKMGIGEFTGQELSTRTVGYAVTDFAYYYGTKAGEKGAFMFIMFHEDGQNYDCIQFHIYHPWFIENTYFGAPQSSIANWVSYIQAQGYTITQGNTLAYSGVSYSMEYIGAYPQRIRLKGTTGKWQASNLKIKSDAKIGQVVKLFLLMCGWKMALNRNTITVTQNYYASLSGITTIQPTVSQITDFRTVSILPNDPLESDVFDILDETPEAVTAIKTAVETNYNRYIPKITKETEFKLNSGAGVPVAGSFVITPLVPGVPTLGGATWNRTYFVYEVEHDQDDTDWYNCKAYNIKV